MHFSKQKLTLAALFFIICLAGLLRLYNIRAYLTFLGDEGRDVLVVKRLIVDHKFTLLGPITSVGSIYMGPIYYYFMAPFLWLWQLDPIGPAIMVVVFSLGTIALLFSFGTFIHPLVGLFAAFMYAIAPLPIIYGRASWNPNIVPFFSLLLMYAMVMVLVKKRLQWFLMIGLSLGILLQLHYVTFIFLPIVLSCFLVYRVIPNRKPLAMMIGSFLLTYSPVLLFELRHQFVNTQGALRFLLQENDGQFFGLARIWGSINDHVVRLFWRLVILENAEITKLVILAIAGVLWWIWRKKIVQKEQQEVIRILLIWLSIGILFLSFYKGTVYDYYYGSLFPLPFLFTGILFFSLFTFHAIGKVIGIIGFVLLTRIHIQHSPLQTPPSNLLNNTQDIASFIFEQTKGKQYNFALIADKNSDHAYRYFLEIWGNPPVVIENPTIDPERSTVMPELFIICEEKECHPLGHPLWEIAGFGRAEIAGTWTVSTAKVFRLIHYEERE